MKLTSLFAVTAMLAFSSAANARGMETFGNKPLNSANYTEWPGIMETVNDTHRVYSSWVNGNEFFYYDGDVAAINEALEKFSGVQNQNKSVLFRPGSGEVTSFDRRKKMKFRWNLHVMGGISKHVTTLEKGDKVWNPDPVLTVYVDKTIDLEKLVIPKDLKVTRLAVVKARVLDGLTSSDKTVRGWGCGELASLDPYDSASRDAIAALLKDPDDWVKLNAAGAIALFGKKAATALPALRSALASKDEQLRTTAQKTIEEIEKAPDRSAEERDRKAIEAQIEKAIK
jgi:hypothetical protein